MDPYAIASLIVSLLTAVAGATCWCRYRYKKTSESQDVIITQQVTIEKEASEKDSLTITSELGKTTLETPDKNPKDSKLHGAYKKHDKFEIRVSGSKWAEERDASAAYDGSKGQNDNGGGDNQSGLGQIVSSAVKNVPGMGSLSPHMERLIAAVSPNSSPRSKTHKSIAPKDGDSPIISSSPKISIDQERVDVNCSYEEHEEPKDNERKDSFDKLLEVMTIGMGTVRKAYFERHSQIDHEDHPHTPPPGIKNPQLLSIGDSKPPSPRSPKLIESSVNQPKSESEKSEQLAKFGKKGLTDNSRQTSSSPGSEKDSPTILLTSPSKNVKLAEIEVQVTQTILRESGSTVTSEASSEKTDSSLNASAELSGAVDDKDGGA